MRIDRVRLRNFRNIENTLVEWGEGINLLTGGNGAGKTNVLESLNILTGWGSFAGARCADVVKWQSSGGAVLAAQTGGERQSTVEAAIVSRASLRIDGKACRWGDLRNCVQSLSFLPSDMELIEGSPAVRRRFLDVICALYFPLYAYKLSEYRKITRHRRYLLSIGHSVRVTQETMASLAVWIWECRTEVVELLRKNLEKWKLLLPAELSIELKRGGAGLSDNFAEDFHMSSEAMAEREARAGSPLVGPHRDDLVLFSSGRPACDAFSRGQRRRSALALVMASASSVEYRYRSSPVLLLDEVTSELDASGRAVLLECLKGSSWQVFATTAEDSWQGFDGTKWRVDGGRIEKLS